MIKPLVTIITTTYNLIDNDRLDYFRKCIETVHSQSYENIEHIIIDGASQDGTIDILKEYEANGWIKYYSKPDTGIYQAMNRGIDRAQGKYILFMNSDDYFSSENAVLKSVELLESTGADVSFADVSYVYDNKKSKLWAGDLSVVFSAPPFSHQTMFTRTDVLKEIGYFNEKYKIASDYEIMIRLVLGGYQFVHLKENIATFRYGGYSSDRELMINEDAQIYCELYKDFCELTFEEAKNIYKFHTLPFRLAKKLSKYLHGRDKLNFWIYNIRKHLFQFRLSKRCGMLRVLGLWIVKP